MMFNNRVNTIGILSLVILALFFTSCRKSKLGVWEVYRDSGIFICSPEDPDHNFGGKEKVYWDDKSCKDLGYTSKGSSEADWYFTSPDGENTPGRNGAFWDDYGSSGGSSSGGSTNCDLANYNGPEFNTQIDSQCKSAYLYDCAGDANGVAASCAQYYQWDDGTSSFPDCPYC